MRWVKQIREELGMSPNEFAAELGMARQSLVHIERGGRAIRPSALLKISDLTGLSGNDIFEMMRAEENERQRELAAARAAKLLKKKDRR